MSPNQKLASIRRAVTAADRKLLRVLPGEKRREFVSALAKISDALEEALRESDGATAGNGKST